MNFESGLINRKQNSHCHMSYSSHNYWFRRDLNVLVGNTRTSFIFLKIFVKNSVKVRHSQQRFRKKKSTAREEKIGSEEIFTTFRKGHWEWKKRRAWEQVQFIKHFVPFFLSFLLSDGAPTFDCLLLLSDGKQTLYSNSRFRQSGSVTKENKRFVYVRSQFNYPLEQRKTALSGPIKACWYGDRQNTDP